MSISFAKAEAEKLVSSINLSDLPVDVKTIATSLNLEIIEKKLDDKTSGLIVFGEDRHIGAHIFVNYSDSEVRKRFTIAHEVGHFVLGHRFNGEQVHVDQIYAIPRRAGTLEVIDFQEVEANNFAASLLMPSKLINEAIEEVETPLFDYDVSGLARRFRVSEPAMTIRLTNLKIL